MNDDFAIKFLKKPKKFSGSFQYGEVSWKVNTDEMWIQAGLIPKPVKTRWNSASLFIVFFITSLQRISSTLFPRMFFRIETVVKTLGNITIHSPFCQSTTSRVLVNVI